MTIKKSINQAIGLLLILLLSSAYVFAQPKSTKFGKVEDKLVKMESYEKDPDASAAILYNYGESRLEIVNEEFQLTYTVHKRIKILSESGFDWAEVSAVYDQGDGDKITSIKGITYNVGEDGKVEESKLQRSSVFDEKINSSWSRKNFTLPNVKAGSVIEYQYSMITQSFTMLPPFYFQYSIPVAYSKYMTHIPTWFTYLPLTKGERRLDDRKTDRYSEMARFRDSYYTKGRSGKPPVRSTESYTIELTGDETSYIMKDVPAITREPFMTTLDDYRSTIAFQLSSYKPGNGQEKSFMSSWQEMSNEHMESSSFGGRLKTSSISRQLINKGMIAGVSESTEPLKKIEAIYNHIRMNTRWNEYYGTTCKDLDEVYEEGEGKGAEINMLIIATLQQAGIEAHPVLISTRSNGQPQKVYPIIEQFNHVIAQVVLEDGKYILLDGTTDVTPFGMLPMRDLNYMGFRISENPDWVDISPIHKFNHKAVANLKLSPDGTLSGSYTQTEKGYAAASARSTLLSYEGNENDYFKEQVINNFEDVEMVEHSIKYKNEPQKPLICKTKIETSDHVTVSGDYIYLEPLLVEGNYENPLKLKERSYPVDFACPQVDYFTLILAIPEGYEVEELPKTAVIKLPNDGGQFVYQAKQVGPSIQLMSKMEIKQVRFMPNEYEIIKQFFDHIVAKHKEQIVLKKKS